jgi:hypothetical protein
MVLRNVGSLSPDYTSQKIVINVTEKRMPKTEISKDGLIIFSRVGGKGEEKNWF